MTLDFEGLYGTLFEAYGPRGWWPLLSLAGTAGYDADGYHPGADVASDPSTRFEIACAALLAQNTAWTNAERAVRALLERGQFDARRLADAETSEIEKLVRPAGFFRQKAARLKLLGRFFAGLADRTPSREELLSIRGVGPETADCILLYAYGIPEFVADAYARRLFARLGMVEEGIGYEKLRTMVMESAAFDAPDYGESHALIVEHAKRHCRAEPRCDGCVLRNRCAYRGAR